MKRRKPEENEVKKYQRKMAIMIMKSANNMKYGEMKNMKTLMKAMNISSNDNDVNENDENTM